MYTIIYQGQLYKFENIIDEFDDIFIDRCWFIIKNIHNYKNNYEYLEKISYIWINIKYLNVAYDTSIMKEIEKCCV